MTTAALSVPAARAGRPGLRALPRLTAFAGLALLGLLTWAALVVQSSPANAVAAALAATVCAGALLAAGAVERRAARNVALAAVAVALLAASLLAAGVPPRMLAPDRWGDLVRGLTAGVGALPGTFVPYSGDDVWVRRTLLLGGTLLTAIAVLQAFWPRERGVRAGSTGPALITLATLYAVPVISISPARPFLSGALFTVLACGFLLSDRLAPPAAAPAALLVAIAATAAALLAPALDRPTPWIDYEHLAEDVAARGSVTYRWNQSYGPIDWPRSGRELLRVRAQVPSYWKTEVLDTFDGRAWLAGRSVAVLEPDGEQDRTQPQWFQQIRVRIRGLRSARFVTAGSANAIRDAPRLPVNAGGGTFETARGVLRRGAEYRALVYTPRPTAGQLASAGTDYPSFARQWLRVQLPRPGARPGVRRTWAEASFAPFGSGGATLISRPTTSIRTIDGAQVVRSTALARIYDLAGRLRRRSATPYDFVRRVRERVQRGAVYSERPAVHAEPLDAFLFDDRRGYCQHFSGAMALLLRMGGVPARVAVGFAPGTADRASGEQVVRDFDAHSWVEAYFPRYGWITFDPTPSASPAREQLTDQAAALRGRRGADPGGDRPGDPAFGERHAAAAQGGDGRSGPPAWAIAGTLAIAVCVALSVAARRRRRPGLAQSDDPAIAELERALALTGRPAAPAETLTTIERRFGGSAAARAYLNALSGARYGRTGARPTAAQRRALRRELASGLGRAGRLRAWWALPPRLSR